MDQWLTEKGILTTQNGDTIYTLIYPSKENPDVLFFIKINVEVKNGTYKKAIETICDVFNLTKENKKNILNIKKIKLMTKRDSYWNYLN